MRQAARIDIGRRHGGQCRRVASRRRCLMCVKRCTTSRACPGDVSHTAIAANVRHRKCSRRHQRVAIPSKEVWRCKLMSRTIHQARWRGSLHSRCAVLPICSVPDPTCSSVALLVHPASVDHAFIDCTRAPAALSLTVHHCICSKQAGCAACKLLVASFSDR